MPHTLEKLEEHLGYTFLDRQALTLALTHKGLAVRSKKRHDNRFERLEFLGDRVLGLAMADILYTRYPKDVEGNLAKRFAFLVSKEACAAVAQDISLIDYMHVHRADVTPQSNIVPDAMESLLGLIYLESGFVVCKGIIAHLWDDLITHGAPTQDSKTALQEWAQATVKDVPTYTLIEVSGPDHAPIFNIQVTVPNIGNAMGRGATKRQAEQQAAHTIITTHHLFKQKDHTPT